MINLKDLEYFLNDTAKELNLPHVKLEELLEYNKLFIDTIAVNKEKLTDEEHNNFELLKNIINEIEKTKLYSIQNIETSRLLNETKYTEKLIINENSFESKKNTVKNKIEKVISNAEREIGTISQANYYKNLEITQINDDYDLYLKQINTNHIEAVDDFYLDKDKKNALVEKRRKRTLQQLDNKAKEIIDTYDKTIGSLSADKEQEINSLTQEISNNEKKLYNQKIKLNDTQEIINFAIQNKLTRESTSFTSHLEYFNNQELELKQKLSTDEVKVFDKFKDNLEKVDEIIESNKFKLNEEIHSINELINEATMQSTKTTLSKELVTVQKNYDNFIEQMRFKKREYDIKKDIDIKKLHLQFDKDKATINLKIKLIKDKLESLQDIANLELEQLLTPHKDKLELEELKIKNSNEILRQKIYFIESIYKINVDRAISLFEHQQNINDQAIQYNNEYYNALINNNTTISSLEMEKNLILKKFNKYTNSLLRDKNEINISLSQIHKDYEIKKSKNKVHVKKRMLSQELNLLEYKNDLYKSLITYEKNLTTQNIIIDLTKKLEIQVYDIIDKRFSIEKKLYSLYLEQIKLIINTFKEYFNKSNIITTTNAENFALNIIENIYNYVTNDINILLEKLTLVVKDHIDFECLINLESEKKNIEEQSSNNDINYKYNLGKMNETIGNYNTVIEVCNKEIEELNRMTNLEMNYIKLDKEKNLDYTSKVELIDSYTEEKKKLNELINKNLKLIKEINSSITTLDNKQTHYNEKVKQQIEQLDKKHKNQTKIYQTFITKIENIKTTINNTLSININTAYSSYYKKLCEISNTINVFINNEVNTLIDKLHNRQENFIIDIKNKYTLQTNSLYNTYNLDIKKLNSSYNEQVDDIEDKIDKIQSDFNNKYKDIENDYKEKMNIEKNVSKSLEIEYSQSKSKLFYDLNTFIENINTFNTESKKNIVSFDQSRKSLSNRYDTLKEKVHIDNQYKISILCTSNDRQIYGLENSYKVLLKEKLKLLENKKYTRKQTLASINKSHINKLDIYEKELVLLEDTYNKALKDSKSLLYSYITNNKKKTFDTINKRNKKHDKDINS